LKKQTFTVLCIRFLSLTGAVIVLFASCAPGGERLKRSSAGGERLAPIAVYRNTGNVELGEPLAVSVDLQGNMYIADGLPGRIVHLAEDGSSAFEFETPRRSPGFYPCDVKLNGFFLYAIDEVGRTLLRFDQAGAYRDILLTFNQEIFGRRISPYGLDVDPSGRIIVTDIENHQILIFDSYLSLEIAFGNFGSYPGQLDSPLGVSFGGKGDVVVADTGNRRVQFFGEGGDLIRIVPETGADNPLIAPRRAVPDPSGRLYVADPEAGRLFVFDKAGELERSIYPEGVDEFQPTDVELMWDGRIYVTDAASRSVFIFKVMSY
jgi:sugar lactone lactonase YvrE